MNSSLRKIISSVSSLFSLDTLIALSGQPLIMPFYHVVSNSTSAHTKHLYPTLSVNRFKQDLDFLQYHYDALDAGYLKPRSLVSINSEEKKFFLSFDDGLREFHDIVAPILLERNIAATCFVNTNYIDNNDMFYRLKISVMIEQVLNKPITKGQQQQISALLLPYGLPYDSALDLLQISDKSKEVTDHIAEVLEVDFAQYLSTHQPYLTSAQIESLIDQGFSIGSHSASHPYYPNLNEDEQVAETLNSIRYLVEKFNIDTRLFSFPYTDFGIKPSFFDRIASEIDFSFGTANLKLDLIETNYQRIPMEIVGGKSAQSIVKSEYLLFIIKRMMGMNTIHRQ